MAKFLGRPDTVKASTRKERQRGIEPSRTQDGDACQPWTYGHTLHIPNNADYTVTPKNGKMMTVQGCTATSTVDPQIAAYHKAAVDKA